MRNTNEELVFSVIGSVNPLNYILYHSPKPLIADINEQPHRKNVWSLFLKLYRVWQHRRYWGKFQFCWRTFTGVCWAPILMEWSRSKYVLSHLTAWSLNIRPAYYSLMWKKNQIGKMVSTSIIDVSALHRPKVEAPAVITVNFYSNSNVTNINWRTE